MKSVKSPKTLWLPGMDPSAPIYLPPSLDSYFLDSYLPMALDRGLSKDRIGELRQAVHRWNWWCKSKDRMLNPVLMDVTAGRLAEFRRDVLGKEIPDRDGKMRAVTPRSLNKTLQAIEQIMAAAIEDGAVDESRGLVRVRKVAQPRQINKLVIPDAGLSRLLAACDEATWPQRSQDGKPIDAPMLWRVAVVMYATLGMRTQDLMRHEKDLRPIRWSCVIEPGPSPAEDGSIESKYGWLLWIPNKTRKRKGHPMCLSLNETLTHWLGQLREAHQPAPDDPIAPIPWSADSLYAQWNRLLAAAELRPKPKRTFDAEGNVAIEQRNYSIKHLRCTAGTRADEHGAALGHTDIGRWVTGHVSNDVFLKHYRGMEKPLMQVIHSLPQPDGFSPRPSAPAPALRVVG
jgi:integrase